MKYMLKWTKFLFRIANLLLIFSSSTVYKPCIAIYCIAFGWIMWIKQCRQWQTNSIAEFEGLSTTSPPQSQNIFLPGNHCLLWGLSSCYSCLQLFYTRNKHHPEWLNSLGSHGFTVPYYCQKNDFHNISIWLQSNMCFYSCFNSWMSFTL